MTSAQNRRDDDCRAATFGSGVLPQEWERDALSFAENEIAGLRADLAIAQVARYEAEQEAQLFRDELSKARQGIEANLAEARQERAPGVAASHRRRL